MIKLGSSEIKGLNYGGEVDKAYIGKNLLFQVQRIKWTLVRTGMTPKEYSDLWTFDLKKGQKIRIVPKGGLRLNVEIFINGNLKSGLIIDKRFEHDENSDFQVKVLSEFADSQQAEVYIGE